eukprot:s703_g3.t1
MEAATAAVPTIDVDENENADTATVAEPEMEVDAPPSEAEQEPDEEMFNEVPDLEEEENAAPDEERRPLILPARTLITDPDLMQARSAMQPSYYRYFPEKRIGRCNDAMRTAFAYMAYCLVRTMYKVWPTTSSWMTMPYFQMQEKFEQGCRYDVLGIVLASSVNLIVKARSAGTSQTKKFLSLRGQKQDTSADTFALLIDHDIQVLAKMTDKVVKRKIDKETNPQAHKGRQALQHLTPADYMAAGQTFESWMHLSRRNSVNVLVVCRMSKVPHPAKETVDEFLGMPTPMSTRATRERASPQLPKNVKMNGNVSGDGNVTIIEDCPYCGRPFGTGYVQVIITHGRFLRLQGNDSFDKGNHYYINTLGEAQASLASYVRGVEAMALSIGAFKVGFAGGGGFGGTAMRYALSVIHGYCFGYCLAILDRFPSLESDN